MRIVARPARALRLGDVTVKLFNVNDGAVVRTFTRGALPGMLKWDDTARIVEPRETHKRGHSPSAPEAPCFIFIPPPFVTIRFFFFAAASSFAFAFAAFAASSSAASSPPPPSSAAARRPGCSRAVAHRRLAPAFPGAGEALATRTSAPAAKQPPMWRSGAPRRPTGMRATSGSSSCASGRSIAAVGARAAQSADVVHVDAIVGAGRQVEEVAAPVPVDAGIEVDAAGEIRTGWWSLGHSALTDATGPGDDLRGSHSATHRRRATASRPHPGE